ncbi:uncharacterized protein LOC115215501 isoform X2 [Octopus sinensis]|uniref:Uncharacterized protein LOC115215501 isoform X2 n=1 Tax=Octopus sinensis TaxID=2607531 RepID=A0A7E6F3B3_9MOLL|nr:uncharacterized protein LOC115215501 isoform X2 [Octopus sinensis]
MPEFFSPIEYKKKRRNLSFSQRSHYYWPYREMKARKNTLAFHKSCRIFKAKSVLKLKKFLSSNTCLKEHRTVPNSMDEKEVDFVVIKSCEDHGKDKLVKKVDVCSPREDDYENGSDSAEKLLVTAAEQVEKSPKILSATKKITEMHSVSASVESDSVVDTAVVDIEAEVNKTEESCDQSAVECQVAIIDAEPVELLNEAEKKEISSEVENKIIEANLDNQSNFHSNPKEDGKVSEVSFHQKNLENITGTIENNIFPHTLENQDKNGVRELPMDYSNENQINQVKNYSSKNHSSAANHGSIVVDKEKSKSSSSRTCRRVSKKSDFASNNQQRQQPEVKAKNENNQIFLARTDCVAENSASGNDTCLSSRSVIVTPPKTPPSKSTSKPLRNRTKYLQCQKKSFKLKDSVLSKPSLSVIKKPTFSDSSGMSNKTFATNKSGQLDCVQSQPDFQFISDELNFLNSESGKLATQLHKSDKQKRLERKRKGSFIRSILKKNLGAKRSKKSERTTNPPPEKSDTESSELDLEIDSSSDFEFEMDRRLEENARKNNLSVMNVKSILHTVITNEHVMAMMNNTLKSAGEVEGEFIEAVYEPKMTRSKIKEVLEKSDGMMTPWPLPSNKISESKVSILDIPFNEDEEDDDYNPEKDTTAEIESDDDTESLNSSLTCSPNLHLMKSSMTTLTENCKQSLTETDDEDKKDDVSEETIARRTRSKLPLHDTSLTELEAHFVAPDITEDMYDTECNDKDWKDFLKSLTKSQDVEDPSEALDDDANDPEYNYLAEAENELPDDEDFRNDRLVRVSKKELHGLLDELFNEDANEEEETMLQPNILTGTDICKFGQPSNVDITVTPEQTLIIAEHMKQHTQLLCQLALLTHGQEDYINESNQCIKFLQELKMFGNQSPAKDKSVFLASNLEGSLKVLEEFQPSVKKEHFCKSLSEDLKKLFVAKSDIFLCSPLLPICSSITKVKLRNLKHTFSPAQDNLLALGFEQFRHVNSFKRCMYIRQLLLPCRTEKQIRARLKNLRSKRAVDNPIKVVAQTMKLPDDFPTATLSQAQGFLSPKGSSPHPDAPSWYKLIIDPPSEKTSLLTRKATKPNSRRKQVKSKKLIESNLQTSKEKLVLSSPPTLAITSVNLVPTDAQEISQNVHLMCGGTTSEVILSDFRPGQLSSSATTPSKLASPLVSFEQKDSSPNPDKSESPDHVASSSIDVIATVASQLLSNSNSIVSARNSAFISEALAKQKELQKTPTKNLLPVYETVQSKGLPSSNKSAVFKHLAPKPQQISPPGCRQISLCLEKKRNSPRRQKLQQKARLICPKGVLIKPHFSPTSMAAYGLRKRAKRSPRMTTRNTEPQTILPKNVTQSPGLENACCNLSTKRLKEVLPLNQRSSVSLRHSTNTLTKNLNDSGSSVKKDDWSGPKTVEKSPAAPTSQTEDTDTAGTASSGITSGSCCQSENENCLLENGDSHIADLMAASSTIGCHQKRSKDTRTKAQKRNDIKLAMLAPNLIEKDPRRDHRDTIFALAYLNKVKETLKTDIERYEQFLRILFEFGKSDYSPVVLYKSLSYLMKDYPELVHDFAAFLSPEHALLCGCYKTTVDFLRARNFLRKIEIIFEKHPSQYLKVLRIFAEWQRKVTHKEEELHEMLLPMFKGQDELLAEFSGLFGFQPPPESQPEDFEEVTLEGGESEMKNKLMGYEDVELPDAANQYGMPGCPCQCHKDKEKLPTDGLNKKKTKSKRMSHCSLCGLTVKDGKLYFKTTGKLKHVRAKISEPFHLSDPDKESKPEEPLILLGDTKLDHKDHSADVCKDENNLSVRSPASSNLLTKHNSPNKEMSSSTNGSSVAVLTSEAQNMKSHENNKVESSPNTAKSVCVDKPVVLSNFHEAVPKISNPTSNDILAKAWEQACRSPTDSVEPDDSLQDLLHIPVNQNQPKTVVSEVGPRMSTDFLLPSQPNLSAIPAVITSTSVTHQLPVTNLTVVPLSTITVPPQLNQITLPTFSHLIPNFNHHNGTLLSKSKPWQLSKVERRGAIDNLLNSAVLSKKHLQVITPNSNDYANQQAISNQLFSEGTNNSNRWTKWMDKMILDSVRKDGVNAQVFEKLSCKINGRTPKQIKDRYSELLQLLEQMKQ